MRRKKGFSRNKKQIKKQRGKEFSRKRGARPKRLNRKEKGKRQKLRLSASAKKKRRLNANVLKTNKIKSKKD